MDMSRQPEEEPGVAAIACIIRMAQYLQKTSKQIQMSAINTDKSFPEQNGPSKVHGLDNGESLSQDLTDLGTNTASQDNPGNRNANDNSEFRTMEGKEKYLGEIANIEDVPSDDDREPVDENSIGKNSAGTI